MSLATILNDPVKRRKEECLELYVHSIIPFERFQFSGLLSETASRTIRETLICTFVTLDRDTQSRMSHSSTLPRKAKQTSAFLERVGNTKSIDLDDFIDLVSDEETDENDTYSSQSVDKKDDPKNDEDDSAPSSGAGGSAQKRTTSSSERQADKKESPTNPNPQRSSRPSSSRQQNISEFEQQNLLLT